MAHTRSFLEKTMNQYLAITAKRIAAVVALLGTLLSVGGTLGLAEHYAHADIAHTSVQGDSAREVA